MKNILFLISTLFLFSCEEEEDFSTPFYFAENGVTVKAKDWVTAGTTGELNGIFYTAVNIDTLRLMFSREEDVSKVVTTLITDMSNLFSNVPIKDVGPYRPHELQFNPNISSWDVSNVTNMQGMFGFTRAFNRDISNWCVSKITSRPQGFHSSFTFEIPEAYLPVWGTCPG